MHTEVLPLYCAPVDARSGADLREARHAAHRARDQRRGDVADGAWHSLRRRFGARAHQPLQRARQGAAPADRADLAGERRSAQGPLRARKPKASASGCMRRMTSTARAAFTPPEVLRTNLASVILQMAALELGEPRGFSVRRSAGHAADQRRLSAAAGAEGRRRSASRDEPRPADRRRCRSIRGWRACCWRRVIIGCVAEMLDHRGIPGGPGSARASRGCAGAGRSEARRVRRSALGLHHRAEPVESVRGAERGAVGQPAAQVVPREFPVVHAHARMAGAAATARATSSRSCSCSRTSCPPTTPTCIRRFSPAFSATSARSMSKREYEGARGTRFVIAPGTPLAVEAAEVGRRGEPHGDDAAVCAHGRGSRAAVDRGGGRASDQAQLQRTALGRGTRLRRCVRVDFAVRAHAVVATARQLRQRRADARRSEIFVREALVEGRTRLRAPFLDHNRRLRREVEQLEAKVRRTRHARRRAGDDAISICSVCRRTCTRSRRWRSGCAAPTSDSGSRCSMSRAAISCGATCRRSPRRAIRTRCDSQATSCRWSTLRARQCARWHHRHVAAAVARDGDAGRLRDSDSGMARGEDHGAAAGVAEADPQGVRAGPRARRARSGGDRRRAQGFQRGAGEWITSVSGAADHGRGTGGSAVAGRICASTFASSI